MILSLAVAGSAAVIGFDRESAFYPTVLIVIASYHVLFAAIAASRRTLVDEENYIPRRTNMTPQLPKVPKSPPIKPIRPIQEIRRSGRISKSGWVDALEGFNWH